MDKEISSGIIKVVSGIADSNTFCRKPSYTNPIVAPLKKWAEGELGSEFKVEIRDRVSIALNVDRQFDMVIYKGDTQVGVAKIKMLCRGINKNLANGLKDLNDLESAQSVNKNLITMFSLVTSVIDFETFSNVSSRVLDKIVTKVVDVENKADFVSINFTDVIWKEDDSQILLEKEVNFLRSHGLVSVFKSFIDKVRIQNR